MLLAYARASLLLDSIPLDLEQIIGLYQLMMRDGTDHDKFETRLYISDVFLYLDDSKASLQWLDSLESDRVLGLSPEQAARIHMRFCHEFMKMQQLQIAYNSAKNAHTLSLMADSPELIINTLMLLSTVSRLSGDYTLSRNYIKNALKLAETHKTPWFYGKCLLELGEVEQFLGAGKNVVLIYKEAQSNFLKMNYAGGYARASMNILTEISKSNPEEFSTLLEEVCISLGQMIGSDPYRLWINVQALSLYDHLLESSVISSMTQVQNMLREQIQTHVKNNHDLAKQMHIEFDLAIHEIEVLKQVESSTRLSVGAIDFYRSSMNKRIDTVSHEIRNAVSILKMSVEAVKDGHIDLNKGMIDTMLKKIESIGSIVDGLDLEESQLSLESEKTLLSQTSVDHIASYCEMAYAYADDRVHIHRDEQLDDAHIVATLLPVTQVIDNLISNALKYSPGSTKVHIHYKSSNNFVTFHVLDQGCGISESDQIHIFEPYYRVSDTTEEGSGLGLHYCRQTIQMLGGEIWVESHLGRGSEFSFSLPIRL